MAASQLYEDVYDIRFDSEGDAAGGCKSVLVEFGADEIEHSACNSKAIDYRGVTKKVVTVTIELEGANLERDIMGVSFGGAIGEAISAEITETGEERMHAGDGACWVQHIAVQKRSVEAKVTVRAIDDADGHLEPGSEVATLEIQYGLGNEEGGCADGAETISLPHMMVAPGSTLKGEHNAYAEATLSFKATASETDVTGAQALTSIHVGDALADVSFSVASSIGGDAKT